MISEALFYLAAVPAVFLFGVSKGGFGGGLGVISVPLMGLVVSPVQAAAILLPILCLMDLFSLWAYRGRWQWPELHVLLPASLIGIATGTLLFEYLSPSVLRLLLGVIAITFTLNHWWLHLRAPREARKHYSRSAGVVAGATAGFTSFVAHAGGPPVTMYLLRRGHDRTAFVGTTVLFFAVVNYVKLLPYAWLGQFDASNLGTSLVLAPLAPVGVAAGVWLHRRISDRFFYRLAYGLLFIVGLKLIYDGLADFQLQP
ncbi:MAG: sulfite exporter TauE/SafE family protein [Gammaproteobacteria bacterium]|nr:sulfite exporter TauE/SafE family protein [Gammaproteobacteria bacterium]